MTSGSERKQNKERGPSIDAHLSHRNNNSLRIQQNLEDYFSQRVPMTEHSPAVKKSDAHGTVGRNSQNQ